MTKEISKEVIAKVFWLYPGAEVKTPDGTARLTQAPDIMFPDSCHVHFGKNTVKTAHSIDGGYDKFRNYGKYNIQASTLVPIDGESLGSIQIPGGVQLILSDLSDISDEDALECCKLATYHPDIAEDYDNIKEDNDIDEIIRFGDKVEIKHTCICFTGSLVIQSDGLIYVLDEDGSNSSGVYDPLRIYDFLRSRGYMLPAFGITDLFEAGIAVRKNKEV